MQFIVYNQGKINELVDESKMKIKNKLVMVMLSISVLFPLQHTFANEDLELVDAAAAQMEATTQISQSTEQKQDMEQLRQVILLVDMQKMSDLGDLGEKNTLSKEDKQRVKAILENMKEVNTQAKKLKMQSPEGKDALKKFIAFNDYNIQYIDDNSMFIATDAEKEKMSLTIGALNQDLMQALSILFVEE